MVGETCGDLGERGIGKLLKFVNYGIEIFIWDIMCGETKLAGGQLVLERIAASRGPTRQRGRKCPAR